MRHVWMVVLLVLLGLGAWTLALICHAHFLYVQTKVTTDDALNTIRSEYIDESELSESQLEELNRNEGSIRSNQLGSHRRARSASGSAAWCFCCSPGGRSECTTG